MFRSPETRSECVQMVPLGRGQVAILWLLSTPDEAETVSAIFLVEEFGRAYRPMLVTTDRLRSLVSPAPGALMALGRTSLWHRRDDDWRQLALPSDHLKRLWASAAVPAHVYGDDVCFRLDDGQWARLPTTPGVRFEDMTGASTERLLACGQGNVLRMVGGQWLRLDLSIPNTRLRGIDVADDGTVRVAGDAGSCLRVALDRTVTTLEVGHRRNFYSVRQFKGQWYWGDEVSVFIEKGNALEPFQDTALCSDMRADDDALYVSSLVAWRFDGVVWLAMGVELVEGELSLVPLSAE